MHSPFTFHTHHPVPCLHQTGNTAPPSPTPSPRTVRHRPYPFSIPLRTCTHHHRSPSTYHSLTTGEREPHDGVVIVPRIGELVERVSPQHQSATSAGRRAQRQTRLVLQREQRRTTAPPALCRRAERGDVQRDETVSYSTSWGLRVRLEEQLIS